MSTGDWNASHYKNLEFDSVARILPRRAVDVPTPAQGERSGWRGLLLRDTPVVTDYFINYVTASTPKVKGYVPEGISQMGTGLRRTSLA